MATLSEMIRDVGSVLSGQEAQKIADKTGKTYAEVLAKAQKLNIGIGAGAVNTYNQAPAEPARTPRAMAAQQALAPLEGLSINRGNVYTGSSGSQTTSSGTTYIPTITQRSTIQSQKKDPYDVSLQPQDFTLADSILADRDQGAGATPDPASPAAPAGPDYNSIMAPFLEMLAATTANSQQQMADLQTMMASGLANSQAMFQQQMEQNLALAEQEKAANRAFMINSGRQTSPANLQLGIGYNQNKLAGTEGFKYRPKQVTAAPIAFSAPTLSASAASQVPTVINV